MFRSFSTRCASALLLALFLNPAAAAIARPHATPTPVATPTPPPEDPLVTKIARREFVAWQSGNVDLTRYAGPAKAEITADKLALTSKGLAALGALESIDYIEPVLFDNEPAGARAFMYKVTCSEGVVYEQLVLDAQGKVAGIVFRDRMPS